MYRHSDGGDDVFGMLWQLFRMLWYRCQLNRLHLQWTEFAIEFSAWFLSLQPCEDRLLSNRLIPTRRAHNNR